LPRAAELAITPLIAAGLKPLALKGAAIVGRYPDPGLRPMDDVDLLVPGDLVSAAAKVLGRAGWRRVHHQVPDPGYDIAFTHPDMPGVPLELHYELARWQERTVEAQRLWAARVDRDVFGTTAWGVPAELELLAFIAHAAKRFHLFGRLLWGVDFTVIIRSATIDWEELARLAAATHSRLAVAVGLLFARRLGAEVPDELMRLPDVLYRSGALDALLDPSRPFHLRASSPRWMGYVLADDVVGKLRLAVGDLVRPPRGEPRAQIAGNIARAIQRGVPRLARASVSGS
jgi:hypothetical protein